MKNGAPLAERVSGFIGEHLLLESGEKLVVAVSGGADSVCLLHILTGLQKELKIKLHVAHLNHQLRGNASDADADYVAALAEKLGLAATIEKRDVAAYQKEQRLSPEEAAREVRYGFLAEVAEAVGASKTAAGHTKDDHIETILMHLIRGSGTRGLRGLQPSALWQSGKKSLTVIRPLLEISHRETEAYCQKHKLMPRLDASNLSLSPLRNRVRQQLMPLLESYNPGIAEALLRTGRIADDDISFLDAVVARFWDKVIKPEGDSLILNKAEFEKFPPSLQRYLLRAAVEKLLGSAKDVEMRHIEEMLSLAEKPAGKRLDLPGGLVFAVEYDRYLLGRDPDAFTPLPELKGEFRLKVPGETLIPGWKVEAAMVTREETGEAGDYTTYLDADKSGRELTVRARQRGDRFQPLGLPQAKKLGEFMIDAKIPQAWRERVPLVCSKEQILWVVGWRLDERVKVDSDTNRVLRLKFEAK
ncbi:MAG: tRNA lysidine(34) synthetase TilS [Dehalococcoidia bacterium]|jgi:tRNA(Ile)-lysidine synthase